MVVRRRLRCVGFGPLISTVGAFGAFGAFSALSLSALICSHSPQRVVNGV